MDEDIEILDKNIKEKITTRNIYKIVNQFIIPTISKPEREFLEELQEYLIKLEDKGILNIQSEDVYSSFPDLGRVNLIQRLNPHGMRRVGFRYELILAICLAIIDPELDLARVVSGILFLNPLFPHREKENIKKIFEDVMTGKKIGCICITEKERGSDAVHMKTTIKDMGDHLILNGEKVFTTNGSKADYFIVYAVSDVENPRGSMYQVLVEREFEGLETHRLEVPSVPRIEIGICRFNNVKIPKTNVLGGKGDGYNNLFNGLVAERTALMGSCLGICWLVASTALIYTNFRKQFGKPIFEYQAVSHPLTKLFIELMAATELGFKAGSLYEKFLQSHDPKYEGRKDIIKFNAAFGAGTKYLASNLAYRLAYEAQQLCGGIAYTNELKIDKALEIAKIQEILGGSRNIQIMIVSRSIKEMIKRL